MLTHQPAEPADPLPNNSIGQWLLRYLRIELPRSVALSHFSQGNCFDLAAFPAVPNSSKRCLQSFFIAFIAGTILFRGSNSDGSSAKTFRIAPVIAIRLSVSMLILRTPCLNAEALNFIDRNAPGRAHLAAILVNDLLQLL